jgi:DNA excision repair protein ERCC-2
VSLQRDSFLRKINIDVRNFAVPSPLVGSIETHSGFGGSLHSGQDIHKIFQQKKEKENSNYIPEKHLSITFDKKPYEFVVSGRADGFINSTPCVIEEIKSSFDIEALAEKLAHNFNHPYYWQLRTYGYIHYHQTGEAPLLKLELISARNFKTISLDVDFNLEDYEIWLERRLDELVRETKIKEKIFDIRVQSARDMVFPFVTPRPGQQELVAAVAENFADSIPLLIEAPTGLGKTAGVLYPALKESLSRGQKVIFVTPKNSQHQVAEAAVNLMQDQGAKIRCLTLTSKAKMCRKAEVICNPQYCEYAKDYYAKLDEHDLVNKVGKMKRLTSRKFIELGEKYQVCPFELSLEGIDRADVVIGDYNYVFSPRSLIGRLSTPLLKPKEKANLVIDEAHNLPSRAQDYFSPSISIGQITFFESQFASLSDKFLDDGIALTQDFIRLIKQYSGESRRITIDPAPFIELGTRIREFTGGYLESDVEIKAQDPVLAFSNLAQNFIESLELTGPEFFQTYQKTYNAESLKVTCCDASAQLKECYKEFKNFVAFSATLKPFYYYQQLLGFPENKTKTYEFASPFTETNRKIMVIPQISTKYRDRNSSAPKICDVIERVLNVKSGNYIALFPSFEFMNMVAGKLNLQNYQVLTQQKEMKLPLINTYLHELREGLKPTLLLGVQGGVFSEGVDYPGHMLIGAFVVGPALPNFDFEREQIRAYYEKRYGSEHAFDYAYVFPAMAKAIQSAGRVVRTETDRGVIILIDPRFLEDSYSQTMPAEWFDESPRELVSQKILQDIKDFWETAYET